MHLSTYLNQNITEFNGMYMFSAPREDDEPVEGDWNDEEDEDFDDQAEGLDDLDELYKESEEDEIDPDDDDHLPDDDLQ
ncbi:MAG: hypothetical protein EOO87_16315 [Pedobacter sp.]|nr:MAG: hypothetical protein EOO87_16315 [Pedobacter sp.]